MRSLLEEVQKSRTQLSFYFLETTGKSEKFFMQIGSISVPCLSYMVEFNSVASEISIINISDVRIQNRLCLFLLT